MSSLENGMKVNMIKQKFENKNIKSNVIINYNNSKDEEDDGDDDDDSNKPKKELLRRSLSASPVRAKKNIKPQIIRQISNPGKNIKRSPAFRGDKFIKTKHLNSLSKDKHLSIVNENIKKFEEQDKCDKLGLIKKKSESPVNRYDLGCLSQDVVDCPNGSFKLKDKKQDENSVKTVVISKRKNIAPLSRLDIDLKQLEIADNRQRSDDLDKFIMNGVEYTKVTKSKIEETTITADKSCEDVSKESCKKSSNLDENPDSCSVKLTDSLKAALEAPLPSGPPPKKPPRTFMHCPILQMKRNKNKKDIHTSNSSLITSKSDPLSDDAQMNSSTSSSSSTKSFKSHKINNSRKMLEKLENVLIQHKNPSNSKVIVPRKEKSDLELDKKKKYSNECHDKSDKINFFNKISRVLDDSINKISSDRKIEGSRDGKNCLFLLNCASSPIYDQATFQSFTEPMQKQLKSKSESFLNCSSNTKEKINSNSNKLFTEMTTYFDEKKQQQNNNTERVYAEPFAFDQNSGTDILGYGKLSTEEHNYLSRNYNKDRFNINFNPTQQPVLCKKNNKPELHYLCTPIESLVFANKNNNVLKSNEDVGKLSGDAIKFQTYPNKSISCPQLIKTEEMLNKVLKEIAVDFVDSKESKVFKDCENNIQLNRNEILHKFMKKRKDCPGNRISDECLEKQKDTL